MKSSSANIDAPILSLDEHLLEKKESINDLIYECALANTYALKIFFHIFSKEIYDFPKRIFHLDEDAASEYFIYAYERLKNGQRFKSFSQKSSFRTWFYSVLRNLLIDWLRSKKESKIEKLNPAPDGILENPGEEPIDFRQINGGVVPEDLALEFKKRLKELDLENRVFIKLCFIYYLDIEMEELFFIKEKSGKSENEILIIIAHLKSILAEKEEGNSQNRDKIISLYNSILSLKEERTIILGKINDLYAAGSLSRKKEICGLNLHLLELDRRIQKKYSTRNVLLEKSVMGLFMVRTPYKYIKDLLNLPNGTISVKIMFAMKKFKKCMGDLVKIYM